MFPPYLYSSVIVSHEMFASSALILSLFTDWIPLQKEYVPFLYLFLASSNKCTVEMTWFLYGFFTLM